MTSLKFIKKINRKKSVKKPTFKTDELGNYILDDKRALLLAEACKLSKQTKENQKRIKTIKTLFNLDTDGEYHNNAGDVLLFTMADKWTEIEVEKTYNMFKKKGKLKEFFHCVKVQLGALEKTLPETLIKKMRTPLDPVAKYSFK